MPMQVNPYGDVQGRIGPLVMAQALDGRSPGGGGDLGLPVEV